jgi:hypothetical protein
METCAAHLVGLGGFDMTEREALAELIAAKDAEDKISRDWKAAFDAEAKLNVTVTRTFPDPVWQEATLRTARAWAAARAALAAQPAPEPVSHQYLFNSPWGGEVWRDDSRHWNGNRPKASRALYTAAPPVRTLSDAEIDKIQEAAFKALAATGYTGGMGSVQWDRANARAIEAALRNKP